VRRATAVLASALAISVAAVPPAARAAGAPGLGAAWATDVAATSARLHAEIDPQGLVTTYSFEYLSAASYQQNLDDGHEAFSGASRSPAGAEASAGSGSGLAAVSRALVGLTPATAYRYRVVAKNGEGTASGEPHLFATQVLGGASPLLDGRGWEMVSPADKNGGEVALPETLFGGGDLQAAAGGGAVTFSSSASFGEGASGAPPASQYVSTRTGGGWTTANVTPPTEAGAYDEPDGVPYRLFSTDLARALVLEGRRCEAGEPCPRGYSLWEGGAFAALPPAAAGMRVVSASSDLGRVIFEAEGGPLYEWSGGGLAPAVLLPPTAGPGAAFEASSSDGSFTFYTEGGHLFRYNAGSESAADLTPSGGVVGVLGISAAGSVAYYQDGDGLQRWSGGAVSEVVAGSEAAAASNWPPATGAARVSADGAVLAFASTAPLTGYDNTDQGTGQPDAQVYLWRAGAGLACISCNPTNERPIGPSSMPGAVANGSTRAYKPRSLVAGGNRLFFESADALVLSDTNNAVDVYEWEAQGTGSCGLPAGCLGLVSSGKAEDGAAFADASASGADAYFLTSRSLVGSDPGSLDLYDAREGGGFPEPVAPIACAGDACQSLPSEPDDPQPGTLLQGPGNPVLRFPPRHCPKGKRRVKRNGQYRCVARHSKPHRRHAQQRRREPVGGR